MPAPTAKQIVYAALKKLLPSTTITDATKLADLGYDNNVTKDILRAAINTEAGRKLLNRGALSGCAKVSDVVKVVQDAMPPATGATGKKPPAAANKPLAAAKKHKAKR